MASTNPARGMRDFLPADVRKRNYVINIIKEVYESYGFEPLETPAVENIETLLGKYGEEGNQLVFKILKRGEKLDESLAPGGNASVNERALSDLALRYDLTVPLARVVANNKNDLPKFFKRYQIQPVWRADRPARGRFREFYQCDVDAIGSNSIVVEVEIILAVAEILTRLGFKGFRIHFNDRRLLDALLDTCRVPDSLKSDFLVVLDKYDKIGLKGVAAEMAERGIEESMFLGFFDVLGKVAVLQKTVATDDTLGKEAFVELNRQVLRRLSDFVAEKKPDAVAAFTDVEKIFESLNLHSEFLPITLSPVLVRGLSYYTGAIMEISVSDLAGSLGGGGRYDGLIGMFGKEQIPACGFSLGLERILVVMEERGMFPPEIAESTPADAMVTIWSEETIADSLRLASELRAAGIRITVYPEADKLGKQFKYADAINVPWVCVLGASEIAENKVTLKNMNTGEQTSFPRAEIAAQIK